MTGKKREKERERERETASMFVLTHLEKKSASNPGSN